MYRGMFYHAWPSKALMCPHEVECACANNTTRGTFTANAFRVKSVPGDWPALYINLHKAIQAGDRSLLEVTEEQYVDVIKLIELGLKSSEEGRVLPFD